jgi:hypothetical protein
MRGAWRHRTNGRMMAAFVGIKPRSALEKTRELPSPVLERELDAPTLPMIRGPGTECTKRRRSQLHAEPIDLILLAMIGRAVSGSRLSVVFFSGTYDSH